MLVGDKARTFWQSPPFFPLTSVCGSLRLQGHVNAQHQRALTASVTPPKRTPLSHQQKKGGCGSRAGKNDICAWFRSLLQNRLTRTALKGLGRPQTKNRSACAPGWLKSSGRGTPRTADKLRPWAGEHIHLRKKGGVKIGSKNRRLRVVENLVLQNRLTRTALKKRGHPRDQLMKISSHICRHRAPCAASLGPSLAGSRNPR